MPANPEPPPVQATSAVVRRVLFGFGPRELGVGGLAVAILTLAAWWGFGDGEDRVAETNEVRVHLAIADDAAEVYRSGLHQLREEQARIRGWAEQQANEPLRTWSRERLRRFNAFVDSLGRGAEAAAFERTAAQARSLFNAGKLAEAKALLEQHPPPPFPARSELERIRRELYEDPLAEFSRQSPALYRTLKQVEPEVARRDEAALRQEIASAEPGKPTPALMLRVELLAAVAAADDPLTRKWSALASALDYFESPEPDTLAKWERAQSAVTAGDWETASREMRGLLESGIRTRQPFRAAYGRALLKHRPEDAAAAYPFLAEAANAGDRMARRWVAGEDLRARRFDQAGRWLEPAVLEGDPTAVPLLLDLYQQAGAPTVEDVSRQIGVLQHVVAKPDAPAEAYMMLARLYERSDPGPGGARKAFGAYGEAAAKGSAEGQLAVARGALKGVGTPVNLDVAREAAAAAFARGQVEAAAPLLGELLRLSPERTAATLAQLLDPQMTAAAPYTEKREEGPGVAQLKGQLARHLDSVGQYGQAARYYAGARDPVGARRHAELTKVRPCPTCVGKGRVPDSAACPTCGGKGHQNCTYCGGEGTIQTAGTPPCTTCGGAGTLIEERRRVTCGSCGGTGKGKGSVIKQDCAHCEGGHIRCPACTDGRVQLTKECTECGGKGAWSFATKGQ